MYKINYNDIKRLKSFLVLIFNLKFELGLYGLSMTHFKIMLNIKVENKFHYNKKSNSIDFKQTIFFYLLSFLNRVIYFIYS